MAQKRAGKRRTDPPQAAPHGRVRELRRAARQIRCLSRLLAGSQTVIRRAIMPDAICKAAPDPRLREKLTPWVDDKHESVVMLGVPFDFGVGLNGGRLGAAEGPAALRKAIARYGTTYDVERARSFDGLSLADAGDVEVSPGDVSRTHYAVTERVGAILKGGATALVVGGGNDISFADIRALCDHYGGGAAVGGLNVDAHFDVREVLDGRVTSGTPYRMVLEDLGVQGERFFELGTHPHVNSQAHHEYLLSKRAGVIGLGEIQAAGVSAAMARSLGELSPHVEAAFVSIDLDVFSAAAAPGVSAPGTDGLSVADGREIAFLSGANPKVKLFELMELNPQYDVDQRTARLGAMLVCAFLSGVGLRGRSTTKA